MSIKEQFYAPLEIRTRKGRGGNFSFVAWQDISDRLNQVLGISWSSEVITAEIIGNNVIVRVRVSFINPETKEYCCQEGFGGAPNDERLEAGSSFKAAYSKSLKDACKKWGLGLYLEDEDQSSFSPPTTTNPAVNKTNIPSRTESTSTPPVSGSPTIPTPAVASVSIPTFPTQSVPNAPVQTTVSIPSVPTANLSTQIPPMPTTNPFVQTPFAVPEVDNTKPLGISDIQKVALGGIISSKGIVFEELVKEAFATNGIVKDPFPSKDDLTYDEAVLIIKYGNDKFRKQ
jgi:hypothetical protein